MRQLKNDLSDGTISPCPSAAGHCRSGGPASPLMSNLL